MERSTISSLLRSSQAWCSQLCEKETLDWGIIYASRSFGALPEASQFREVIAEDGEQIATAFEEVEKWYAAEKLRCCRWAPASGTPSTALERFLTERGFQRRDYAAMLLTEWVELPASGEVRVLPARAMRQAFRDTYLLDETIDEEICELCADAAEERMNDPQLDMFIAQVDKKPTGRAGLYQVGDIARVVELSVLQGFEASQIVESLLGHVLTLAKRLQFSNVLAKVESGDAKRLGWFTRAGFVADGEIVEFDRPMAQDSP